MITRKQKTFVTTLLALPILGAILATSVYLGVRAFAYSLHQTDLFIHNQQLAEAKRQKSKLLVSMMEKHHGEQWTQKCDQKALG